MMRYLLFSLLLSAVVIGCNESDTQKPDSNTNSAKADKSAVANEPASKPINEFCPIMGGEVVADGGSAEWNGKTIGFCCPECDSKWNALSEEEKTTKLAAANEKAEKEHDHKDHDHADHKKES